MQLMSIADLAAYLGDSKRTIYKYIASGDCPPYIRISSKNIKFDRADVDAWLESKKVQPGLGCRKMNNLEAVDHAKGIVNTMLSANKLPCTPRAQAVLEEAQRKARADGAAVMGSEHVLFGIMSVRDCLGATILRNLGVRSSEFSDRYQQLSKPSDRKASGEPRVSEDIDRVIQRAGEQAVRWGHKYIGAEHLLAGILLAGTGVGFQILTGFGVTLEKVQKETAKLVVCRSEAGQ
jgi:excisionase family DNA binding protein